MTEMDGSVQNSRTFLSNGRMPTVRNSTANEPAFTWPIGREASLGIVGSLSLLSRRLVASVCAITMLAADGRIRQRAAHTFPFSACSGSRR